MAKFKVQFTHPKVGMGDLSEHVFDAKPADMSSVPFDTSAKAVAKEYDVPFNQVKIHKIWGM
jgi:hypothetical protein